jgi:methyl-accepting chemotaxis protein
MRFIRFVAVVIVILALALIVCSIIGSETITNSLLKSISSSAIGAEKTRLGIIETDTHKAAVDASELVEIGSGLSRHDPARFADVVTEESYRTGMMYVVADSAGNTLWSTEKAPSYVDFTESLTRDEVYTDIYTDGTLLYYGAFTPITYMSQRMGTVFVAYDLAATEYLDSVAADTGCEMTLFLGDIRYSTTVLDADGNRAVGTQLSSSISNRVLSGKTVQEQATVLGEICMATYEPLTDSHGNILGIIFAGRPTSDARRIMTVVIIITIIIAAIFGLAAILMLNYFTKKTIVTPILSISGLMSEMKNGRLDATMKPFKRSKDEISGLASDVEQTAQALKVYIDDITQTLDTMARGDYTRKPEAEYVESFAIIGTAMTDIAEKMKLLIGNIQDSSNKIRNGSSELSVGAMHLAEGTAEQAGTIEALLHNVEDISHKVQANAQNANSAKNYSDNIALKIEEEQDAIDNLLKAIGDIERKSGEISQVISTIDNIAFQTNIIAINAAVEAARAGTAGKSFAVVAEEVRNLAESCAEAANSTTTLIQATVTAVNTGSKHASNVATAMNAVREISEKTNRLMDEIDADSSEQADSLSNLSDGMAQISAVVQQNSATSEESSAACSDLNNQIAVLNDLIKQFKV